MWIHAIANLYMLVHLVFNTSTTMWIHAIANPTQATITIKHSSTTMWIHAIANPRKHGFHKREASTTMWIHAIANPQHGIGMYREGIVSASKGRHRASFHPTSTITRIGSWINLYF